MHDTGAVKPEQDIEPPITLILLRKTRVASADDPIDVIIEGADGLELEARDQVDEVQDEHRRRLQKHGLDAQFLPALEVAPRIVQRADGREMLVARVVRTSSYEKAPLIGRIDQDIYRSDAERHRSGTGT